MSSFAHRRPSREERWVAAYETLVASLHGGHETSVDEYANDLSCRQSLEDNREDPHAKELRHRIQVADTRLRTILRPTKRCVHGSYPPSCFWYWGCPPSSPEPESDLVSLAAL